MEWDLLRAGVSWGASTDTAWKTETKGTFNQEPLRYKLERQKFQTVDIIKLNGSVELGPIVELSDVIVDIVETGSTLKENGLMVLEEICPLSARMIVNPVSMQMQSARIKDLLHRIRKQLEEEKQAK